MESTAPEKEPYDGVPVRVIGPRGNPEPQYMSTTGAKGRGRRRGVRRGSFVTENKIIEKQKEINKKKNNKKKKKRRKNGTISLKEKD
tara:strand:- start:488 stop:748 length:261 start_codon:yes stop_codon:yes gene_type:complete